MTAKELWNNRVYVETGNGSYGKPFNSIDSALKLLGADCQCDDTEMKHYEYHGLHTKRKLLQR